MALSAQTKGPEAPASVHEPDTSHSVREGVIGARGRVFFDLRTLGRVLGCIGRGTPRGKHVDSRIARRRIRLSPSGRRILPRGVQAFSDRKVCAYDVVVGVKAVGVRFDLEARNEVSPPYCRPPLRAVGPRPPLADFRSAPCVPLILVCRGQKGSPLLERLRLFGTARALILPLQDALRARPLLLCPLGRLSGCFVRVSRGHFARQSDHHCTRP